MLFRSGVFEPGSTVVVDNIVVGNRGGLALPTGAKLRVSSCENCSLLTTSAASASASASASATAAAAAAAPAGAPPPPLLDVGGAGAPAASGLSTLLLPLPAIPKGGSVALDTSFELMVTPRVRKVNVAVSAVVPQRAATGGAARLRRHLPSARVRTKTPGL